MDRIVLGLTENITLIGNHEKEVTARIDTGATSSSIDTRLVKSLNLGPEIAFRTIKSASGVKQRSIIKVKVKINGLVIDDEFSVADRSHMTYPVLIGQNILKKWKFIIDPQKE